MRPHRVIVCQSPSDPDCWDARFEGNRHESWTGETPAHAMRRLFGACPERGIIEESCQADYDASTATRHVIVFDGFGVDVVV